MQLPQCATADTLVVLLPAFSQACDAAECFYRIEILNDAVLDDAKLTAHVLKGNRISTFSGAFACPPSASSSECVVREEGAKDNMQIESESRTHGKDGGVNFLLQYSEKCVGFEDHSNDAICTNRSVPCFSLGRMKNKHTILSPQSSRRSDQHVFSSFFSVCQD